jgi:primosomal protein N'
MNESRPVPPSPLPYADVAVNRPIRATYTYRIPPALAPWVRPGSMVRVPVRGQSAEGVVTRLPDPSFAPEAKLKEYHPCSHP